jgi:two-component system response regulator AtoC
MGNVLVVDDDPAVGTVLQGLLQQGGVESSWVASAAMALEYLARHAVDAVVTDLRMPGMDGMQLLQQIGTRFPEVPVIMMTAHGTVPLAVEAMKAGAADFVLKPFDRQEILYTVRKVLTAAPHAEEKSAAPGSLLGGSDAMREVERLLDKVAAGDATVLLRGESGTGKELAARALHQRGRRRAGPFVKVHCAALPDALLESELFGYEKGAFTGAASRKPGRVELAEGGTLFLDEIGDVTSAVQVKLLRLLQDRAYERLGGTSTLRADVRFVTATHRNLEEMVKAGQFREDLFYRLNVVPIWLPPLRDRPGDVARLARHFCAAIAASSGRQGVELAPEAVDRLAALRWPGNVRQLQNFIERLIVLSDGPTLSHADVERELSREQGPAAEPARASPGLSLESRRQDAERDALRDALARAGGNRTMAARLLGISRRTLYSKLAELSLD